MTNNMLNPGCTGSANRRALLRNGARLRESMLPMQGNTPAVPVNSCFFDRRKQVVKLGKNRSAEGSCVVELGAALTMLLPVIVMAVYLIWQGLYFSTVNQQMSTLAQKASRACAILYGKPGGCLMAPPGSAEITLPGSAIDLAPYSAFIGQLRIPGVVQDNSQFTFKFCPPVQERSETDILIRRPGFVTVTVNSTNTWFPNPDVLHLRNRLKLPVAVCSTSLLE